MKNIFIVLAQTEFEEETNETLYAYETKPNKKTISNIEKELSKRWEEELDLDPSDFSIYTNVLEIPLERG